MQPSKKKNLESPNIIKSVKTFLKEAVASFTNLGNNYRKTGKKFLNKLIARR